MNARAALSVDSLRGRPLPVLVTLYRDRMAKYRKALRDGDDRAAGRALADVTVILEAVSGPHRAAPLAMALYASSHVHELYRHQVEGDGVRKAELEVLLYKLREQVRILVCVDWATVPDERRDEMTHLVRVLREMAD